MKSILVSMWLLLSLAVPSTFADGPPHNKNNRYTGGDVIVMSLTIKQIYFLDSHDRKPDDLLQLTPKQTKIIKRIWGVRPTKLEIWETRKGWWDCSCMSANLGLRFAKDKIEIPRRYVMSDKEASRTRNPESD